MLAAGIIFALSLLGIIALFSLKQWELSHGRIIAPALRHRGDIRAMELKDLAYALRKDLAKLVPQAVLVSRFIIHEAALALAALARFLERQAHRLADFVSHKRGFERRQTRSEFLKKVSEHNSGSE